MASAPDIQFGTDGWRAVIGDTFTFENVRCVAQATADHFARAPRGKIKLAVIGYDRRFLSDEFAASAAEVMAGNGFQVLLSTTPVPTPAVSWWVAQKKGRLGVMITASHNPPRFNGFKIKLHHGGPADASTCRSVEAKLNESPPKSVPLTSSRGKELIRKRDLLPRYFSALRRQVDMQCIDQSQLNVAHDAMFGTGAGCFDGLLADTRCKIRTLNYEHDPNFGGISPEPIEKNYLVSSAILQKQPADICLVTDGDADRIGGMSGTGRALTTHQIICLLLWHFLQHRKGQGRVVKALTTSSMVDNICIRHNLPLQEVGVGFKYICEQILKGGVLLGFEESGGVGVPHHLPERDGLLAGLLLLECLAITGKPLNTLLEDLQHIYGLHTYGRVDANFPLTKRTKLMQYAAERPPKDLLGAPLEKIQTFDGVKYTARNGCWLMLRGSGTEPIVRIYAEAPTEHGVDVLLEQGTGMLARVDR